MSSLQNELKRLAEYMAAVSSNAAACAAADTLKASIEAASLGLCTVDPSWLEGGGADVRCSGKLNREADIRKLLHAAADAHSLILKAPERRDGLATFGSIVLDYGPLRLSLMPDGQTCRRVQVGVRQVEAREEPVYEIVCDEEEPQK